MESYIPAIPVESNVHDALALTLINWAIDLACPAQPFRVKFWHFSPQMFRVLTGQVQ
jgi:hypothetical protein